MQAVVPKLAQVSFGRGEVSPAVSQRNDLQFFASALRTARNFFIRPTGGASNRAGLPFVHALDNGSLATLIPFIRSTEISYMLVFQEETVQVFSDGAFVVEIGPRNITAIADGIIGFDARRTITTSVAHGFTTGQMVTLEGIIGTGSFAINGTWEILSTPTAATFRIIGSGDPTGSYVSGGTASILLNIDTPYQSEDLADLRFTQSADVLTVTHRLYPPHEFVRTGASTFTFAEITDFMGGPFLDENVTATTIDPSGSTGSITLTASTSIFTADHVGALIKLTVEDLSAYQPWEPNKFIAAAGVDPDAAPERRYYNGKVYVASGNAVAPSAGTFTGTIPPNHDEGVVLDGDLGLLNGVANTRAGVYWEYLHSFSGIARITAQAGTTATATVLDHIPGAIATTPTTKWAFGAWSEDQGYPDLCTYFGDRLVFARDTTEWASKVGDYHNFATSSPLVANDAITQKLNARQINTIQDLVPADQLLALTASASWASPKRGETWTPQTIGYDPQSFDGAAFLRSILTGPSVIFAQYGSTKVRDLQFGIDGDKFSGEELSVLARHLFEDGKTIVDMDYAKEPHGILWMVRSDGKLIGLTYLKEQQVIAWHRHDTRGYFERVCVIPENGVDTPYFVVRRTVNGSTVRYLERMAVRDQADILDSFHLDSGLTYDGRNGTATTIAISGASYDGGQTVTLTASASLFAAADIGDAIQFPIAAVYDGDDLVTPSNMVRAVITAYTSATVVSAELQTPVPAELQATATATWTFARDTFTGLDHLANESVMALADGCPEGPFTVTDVDGVWTVVLDHPAGVVHIGLPYTCDIETLDVTIFGASESIRDNAKSIPQVSLVVHKTLGLKVGPNAANLETIGLQPTGTVYAEPWPLQSEVQTAYLATSWDKNGRILIRQANPLPATILACIPHVSPGGSG